jgi:hypothetical protein
MGYGFRREISRSPGQIRSCLRRASSAVCRASRGQGGLIMSTKSNTLNSLPPAGPVNAVDGLALRGYDPVAYVMDHRAAPGRADIFHVLDGVTYRFTTAQHRDAFVADPQRHLPQYGGYCALAAAEGQKADADPTAFAIVDGKLYLNYDKEVQADWGGDVVGNVAKADANWPTTSALGEVER